MQPPRRTHCDCCWLGQCEGYAVSLSLLSSLSPFVLHPLIVGICSLQSSLRHQGSYSWPWQQPWPEARLASVSVRCVLRKTPVLECSTARQSVQNHKAQAVPLAQGSTPSSGSIPGLCLASLAWLGFCVEARLSPSGVWLPEQEVTCDLPWPWSFCSSCSFDLPGWKTLAVLEAWLFCFVLNNLRQGLKYSSYLVHTDSLCEVSVHVLMKESQYRALVWS